MNKYTHKYLYRNDLFLNIVVDCLKKNVYYIHVHYTHENDIINELIISIFTCILLQTACVQWKAHPDTLAPGNTVRIAFQTAASKSKTKACTLGSVGRRFSSF